MKRSVLVLIAALLLLNCIVAFASGDTDKFEIVVRNAVDDADQLKQLQTCKDIIKIMIIVRLIEDDRYTVFYGGDNAQLYGASMSYLPTMGRRRGRAGQGQGRVLRGPRCDPA